MPSVFVATRQSALPLAEGLTVRLIILSLTVGSLLFLSTGCALFKKKDSGGGSGLMSDRPPPKFPTDPLTPPAPASPSATGAVPASNVAIIAGQILDPASRPLPNTQIRWVNLDEDKDGGDAVDVAADGNGYFTIEKLRPGAQYKLVARTTMGTKTLGGVAYTQAPNVHLVIQVREDLAKSAATSLPETRGGEPRAAFEARPLPTLSGVKPAFEPDLPVSVSVPTASTAPPARDTAANEKPSTFWPPTLSLPKLSLPKAAPPKLPPRAPALPTETSNLNPRIPSCIVLGNKVVSLALHDTRGDVWSFTANRQGRVFLLEFWSTSCKPCVDSMPLLAELNARYAPQGLEMIGIALETHGSATEQSMRVNEISHKQKTNYRQLLGEPSRSNITAQFNITSMPTLLLLDDHGQILLRHEGKPDAAKLQEIERLLSRHLSGQVL